MIAPCEGRHELIIIMKTRDEAPDTFKVVRWCRNCGAVVIDLDYDARTLPGAICKMMFPASAKPA